MTLMSARLPASSDAAVAEAVDVGGGLGLLVDHELERELLAAGAVAGPVGEQVGGERGVADEPAVGAAVGEADRRRRVLEHGADGVVVAVDVAAERAEQQRLAVLLEQPVEHDLLRAAGPRGRRSASTESSGLGS